LQSEFVKETYVLEKIPLEEQRVIDGLVGLWQTRDEPRDLLTHISGTLKPGGYSVTFFFAQVRDDLRTDKHSKYAASSTFEFRQFLEAEYRRLDQANTERQAQAQAEAQAQAKAEAERQAQAIAEEREEQERRARIREERVRRAKAAFDALGKEMEKATTTRAERVELGRKRADLAPYTGGSYVYEKHCWNCYSYISSAIHARCPGCRWYICSNCGSCSPDCNKTYNPFLDMPDEIL